MPRLALVVCILLVLMTPESASPSSTSKLQSCIKKVSRRYDPLKRHATLQQERQFQADLARCSAQTISSSQASCIGAARYDLTRLASMLMKKQITPAQYLQRAKDRNRKADRCFQDRRWSSAYVVGDRDD